MRQVRLQRKTDPLVKRVIILSQARSGSTLLQRILHCCIPDANIHGENHDFWGHTSNSYYAWKTMWQRPEAAGTYTREDNFKPCWWNSYPLRDLVKTYRRLFDDMYQARTHRVIGFKEVRVPQDREAFQKYIAFFRELFPSCVFIFTCRDINQIVKSGWWKEADRGHLANMEAMLREYARNNPDHVYLMPYEDLRKADRVQKLFEYLKEPFNGAVYERVRNKVM